jgi:hypothetical protein
LARTQPFLSRSVKTNPDSNAEKRSIIMQFAVRKIAVSRNSGVFFFSGPLLTHPACEKTVPFLSFAYVCPEPVLLKRSFVFINGF